MAERIKRSEILTALLLAGVAAALTIVNIPSLSMNSLFLLSAGYLAYYAYVSIAEFTPTVRCDYIQSGEGAVGTLALFIAVIIFGHHRYILAATAAIAVFFCLCIINTALSPKSGEQVVFGIICQAAAAVIAAYLVGDNPARLVQLQAVAMGLSHLSDSDMIFAAFACAAGITSLALTRVLSPSLRLHALGRDFSHHPAIVDRAVSAGLFAGRSILLAATLLSIGWTSGIGLAVKRTTQGRLRTVIVISAIIAAGQITVLIARHAGTVTALASSFALSYAAFIIQILRRPELR